MKILKSTILSIALAATLASCDSENSNTQTIQFGMLNYAESAAGGEYSLGSMTVVMNFSNTNENSLTLENLLLPGNSNYGSQVFNSMSSKLNNEGYEFTKTSATGVPEWNVTGYIRGAFNNAYYTLNSADNTLKVWGMRAEQTYPSVTSTTDEAGKPYNVTSESERLFNIYSIVINNAKVNTAERTLNFYLQNASLYEGMEPVTFVVQNVPFSISGGVLSFDIDEAVPGKVAGSLLAQPTVMKGYKVTGLKGRGMIGGTINAEFVWEQPAEGTTAAKTVNASSRLMNVIPSPSAPKN